VKSRSVYVALLLVQVFFATLPIAVKVAFRDFSSPALALIRVAGGALLFLVIQRIMVGERIRSRRDYVELAVYSLFGVIANQLLYITALSLTTATAAQTFVAAGPALTLLTAIALRKETASRLKWGGIVLAAAGSLLLVGVGGSRGAALGNLLALLNVTCYSIYLVISRGLLKRYHPLTVITWVFVFGVPGMLPWGAGPVLREAGSASALTWAAMAYIIVIPTVAAYYLNVYALAHVESSVVSVFVYVQPVLTGVLAVTILGEHTSARLIPAAILIFAGVMVTALAARRERVPPRPARDIDEVVEDAEPA
jgi:drug/metabolite transporter (DMT)-like permease